MLAGSKAARYLLFHLTHSQVTLRPVIGERYMRFPGKEQHRLLILFHPFPQVMSIRLGNPAPLAVLPGWYGRELLPAPGQDVSIAFLQILVLVPGQLLPFPLGDDSAGLLQQALHVGCPGVTIGVNNEDQLPQQVRTAQAMAALIIGEIGGPAVMDDHPTIAGDHADSLDGDFPAFGVQEL